MVIDQKLSTKYGLKWTKGGWLDHDCDRTRGAGQISLAVILSVILSFPTNVSIHLIIFSYLLLCYHLINFIISAHPSIYHHILSIIALSFILSFHYLIHIFILSSYLPSYSSPEQLMIKLEVREAVKRIQEMNLLGEHIRWWFSSLSSSSPS